MGAIGVCWPRLRASVPPVSHGLTAGRAKQFRRGVSVGGMRWLASSDHASLVDRDPAFVEFKYTRRRHGGYRSISGEALAPIRDVGDHGVNLPLGRRGVFNVGQFTVHPEVLKPSIPASPAEIDTQAPRQAPSPAHPARWSPNLEFNPTICSFVAVQLEST